MQVLDKFVPKITHDNDGLIFNPLEDVSQILKCVWLTDHLLPQPYEAGQCSQLLKWKPPSLNTVDFKLTIVEEAKPG